MFCTMLNEGSQNAESIRLVNRLSKTAIERVVVNEVDLRGEAPLLQGMLGSTCIVYTPVEMKLCQLELPHQGSSGQAGIGAVVSHGDTRAGVGDRRGVFAVVPPLQLVEIERAVKRGGGHSEIDG